MARDGSGTFSLPLPDVAAGTDIESSWANTTLTDVETEMTDSLSRSGKGGMSAALKLASGTVTAPGLSFTSEANSGVYRASAGDVRGAVGGADIWRMTSAGFQMYVSAAWVTPLHNGTSVALAGAQTITGAKTFDASPIIGVAGQGIDFAINTGTAATGATTVSELLDFYEEGTWTLNLWDSSASSSEGQTYTERSAKFTRIGNVVFISGNMQMSSVGTLTTSQNCFIGPLPYTPSGSGAICVGYNLHEALAAPYALTGTIDSGANYFSIHVTDATNGVTQLTIAEFGSAGRFYFSGHYFV